MDHKILIKEKDFVDISLKQQKFWITIYTDLYNINDIVRFQIVNEKGIYPAHQSFIIDEIKLNKYGLQKGFCILILDDFLGGSAKTIKQLK